MDVDYSFLQALWFILIAVLWIGFFVLEGFDFGVGMLLRHIGRTENDRRAILHSIGPMWDGNEVWLITAGGAMFAAFPLWYASLFSGFYIALFLVLFALIIRGVSFEFWAKDDRPAWRATWEWATVIGSFLASLLFGVAWANIVRGVPINAKQNFTGDLFTLLNPYALLGGVTLVLLFLSHGAIFLNMKTGGELPERARAVARWASPAAAVAGVGFLIWTLVIMDDRTGVTVAVAVAAIIAALLLATAAVAELVRRPGVAFIVSTGAIVMLFVTLFVDLFPNVMPSSTSPAFNLTIANTSSSHMTLTLMAIVAAVMVPIVLAYTAWAYWVFRKRVSPEEFDLEHEEPDRPDAGQDRRRRCRRLARRLSAWPSPPSAAPRGSTGGCCDRPVRHVCRSWAPSCSARSAPRSSWRRPCCSAESSRARSSTVRAWPTCSATSWSWRSSSQRERSARRASRRRGASAPGA